MSDVNPFMGYLHDFYLDARPLSHDARVAELPQSLTEEPLPSLSDSDIFSIFVAIHVSRPADTNL
jgi:hypothetical protein